MRKDKQKETPEKESIPFPMFHEFDRESIKGFLARYLESGMMYEDFRVLKPQARLDLMTRMASYVVPKLKSTELSLDMGIEPGHGDILEDIVLSDGKTEKSDTV